MSIFLISLKERIQEFFKGVRTFDATDTFFRIPLKMAAPPLHPTLHSLRATFQKNKIDEKRMQTM